MNFRYMMRMNRHL